MASCAGGAGAGCGSGRGGGTTTMSEAAVADTRRLNAKPQDLTDAYGPPSNFLEIDIFNPQTVGMGRARYTSYELRMRVRPPWGRRGRPRGPAAVGRPGGRVFGPGRAGGAGVVSLLARRAGPRAVGPGSGGGRVGSPARCSPPALGVARRGGGGLCSPAAEEKSPGPASRAVLGRGWQPAGGSPAGSRSERCQPVGLPGPFGIQRGPGCTRTRRGLPQQAPVASLEGLAPLGGC